jgi:hypothetical protein
VARTNEPLTSTDVRDLAAVLDVPPSWLAQGWEQQRRSVTDPMR